MNTSLHAYTLNVSLTDGSELLLKRRERPELRFRPDGSPYALVTGVQGPGLQAWSFQQPLV